MNGPKIYFTIPLFGGIPITQTTVSSFTVMLLLCIAGIVLGSNLQKRPSRRQVLVEKGVTMLYGMIEDTMGKHNSYWTPYIGALFLSSIFGSYIGMTGIFRSSTADLSTTVTWALMTSVICWACSIKANGVLGWLKGFTEPVVVMTPMNIISEIAPYLGIAADGEDRSQTVVTVPNLVGTEWSSAQVQLNIKGLRHQLAESTASQAAAAVTYQYPHAGAKVAYGTTVYLYTDTYEGSHTDVPDVTGKSADFARQMLNAAGLNCTVEGSGTVQSQSEAPGSSVQQGTIVHLICG